METNREGGDLARITAAIAATFAALAATVRLFRLVGIDLYRFWDHGLWQKSLLIGGTLLLPMAIFWFVFGLIIDRIGERAAERTVWAFGGLLLVLVGSHLELLLAAVCIACGLSIIIAQTAAPSWTFGAASERTARRFYQRWPSLQWLEGSSVFGGVRTKAAKQRRIAALVVFGLAGIAFILAVGGFWQNGFALIPAVVCVFLGAVGLVLASNAVDDPAFASSDEEFAEVDPELREAE